jgi:hypothetical protein
LKTRLEKINACIPSTVLPKNASQTNIPT